MLEFSITIYVLFFAIAFIYSSVGHGGASGYLAVLVLAGLLTPQLVPVVLILNIVVSFTAFIYYSKEGYFRWHLFWPFALASIPAAFMGGRINLDGTYFYMIVGFVLLLMATAILYRIRQRSIVETTKPLSTPVALGSGAGIGVLSGLIGVGGGIFLTPLMLAMKWANIREIASVSALFVLVNSASGLAGHAFRTEIEWMLAAELLIPVLAGGIAGSLLGVKTKNPDIIKIMLVIVLVIAGLKMLLA